MRKLLLILLLLLLLLVSCSQDSNTVEEVPEPITGTVKYVVDSTADKLYIKYYNENKKEATSIVDTNHWEYTFEAEKDDLIYIIAQNLDEVSVIYVEIFFNDEIISSVGCSSNSENTCWAINKVP